MVDWTNKLLLTVNGRPISNLANALTVFREAPEWQCVLRYDDFGLRTMAMRPPPWAKNLGNSWQPTQWTDHDDSLAAEWLQRHGINVQTRVVSEAIETVAKEKLLRLKLQAWGAQPDEALRRGLGGSDSLLILLLKRRRAQKYR